MPTLQRYNNVSPLTQYPLFDCMPLSSLLDSCCWSWRFGAGLELEHCKQLIRQQAHLVIVVARVAPQHAHQLAPHHACRCRTASTISCSRLRASLSPACEGDVNTSCKSTREEAGVWSEGLCGAVRHSGSVCGATTEETCFRRARSCTALAAPQSDPPLPSATHTCTVTAPAPASESMPAGGGRGVRGGGDWGGHVQRGK